ncbi:YicC family protein [Crocinitomicaceae bacterium]|nr:YicC family protein [Crocinitomicaceae bacterium]MDC1243909.1 YicC family protein [Crocinitomicaceae bacterium]
MTGFGKSNTLFESRKVSIEIRTLNSKGLDLNMKIPSIYKEAEPFLRKLISNKLTRGKIEFSLFIESEKLKGTSLVNRDVATSYYNEIKSLNESWGEEPVDYLGLVLRLPDVLNNDTSEIEESEINQLKSLTSEACEMVESFRKKEGLDLQNEFCKRVGEIRKLMDEIVPFEKERLDATRERLLKGLNEINSEKVDNNRFEQEMIFYIEKLDIAEEKMRLSNHLSYFEETLELPNSGKKLGFIAQEMGREINTIGSKCNHSEMQRRVVLMKDSLEKIKEQVLNTL